jgi:hypothetical protein
MKREKLMLVLGERNALERCRTISGNWEEDWREERKVGKREKKQRNREEEENSRQKIIHQKCDNNTKICLNRLGN